MSSFTIDAPMQRLSPDHADENESLGKPRASFSSCDGSSTNLTSSGTDCTRGGVISPSSYSSSSYHGSQDDLEDAYEAECTERMEALVSDLLQDDREDDGPEYQREYQNKGWELPLDIRCLSVKTARRLQEFQIQRPNRCERNGLFGQEGDHKAEPYRLASNRRSARVAFPLEMVFPNEERYPEELKEVSSSFQSSFCAADVHGRMSGLQHRAQHKGSGYVNPPMIHEYQKQTPDEMLRQPENNIVADSIVHNSLFRGSDVDQYYNEALQREWPPSNTPANTAFEAAVSSLIIREANRLKPEPIHTYLTPRHPWSQRTLETGYSSSLPTILGKVVDYENAAASVSAKFCNVSSEASVPFPGRTQLESTSVRSRETTLPKKMHGHNCKADTQAHSPPQVKVVHPLTGFHPRTPTPGSPQGCRCAGRFAENQQVAKSRLAKAPARANNVCLLSQSILPAEQKGYKYRAASGGKDAWASDGNSVRLQNSPATIARRKAKISKGLKSISIVLEPTETAAPRARCCYPPASSCPDGSALVSTDSGSSVHRRQPTLSDADAVQLNPIEDPTVVKLSVCNQGQFKTELCNNWQKNQDCPYGDHCRFAHGDLELRPANINGGDFAGLAGNATIYYGFNSTEVKDDK